jgi:hypothetical protein
MVPMGTNTDEWISDIASYIRNSFGNSALFVTTPQVAAVRKQTARKSPWTQAEIQAAVPRALTNPTEWILSASHNLASAPDAISGSPFVRWDTGGAAQEPGMWFQIELPAPVRLTEIQIDSTAPFTINLGRRGSVGLPPTPRARAVAGAPAAPAPALPGRGRGGRGGPPSTGPVEFSVQVSADGVTWGSPVASGAGTTPTTVVSFAPVATKFVRITQNGRAPGKEQWSIAQIRLYELAQ